MSRIMSRTSVDLMVQTLHVDGRHVVLPWWMAAVIYFAMAHSAMAHSVGWVRYPAAVTFILHLAGVLWRRFRR